jgi:hypothetical protein
MRSQAVQTGESAEGREAVCTTQTGSAHLTVQNANGVMPLWRAHSFITDFALIARVINRKEVNMKIMCRRAEDDFEAMLTAQGMEDAGVNVFSISGNGQDTHPGALSPHTRYVVWGKALCDDHISKADDEISRVIADAYGNQK